MKLKKKMKGKELRNFLYNINKEANEENEHKITDKKDDNNNTNIDSTIKKEETNKELDDFEILPDITEELKNVFGKPMDIIQKKFSKILPLKTSNHTN